MPKQKDYYELLGVARDASPDVIRKAYLKLAHKYHPDKTGGDKAAEEKLKEINEAYDTLKNPDKRAHYDRFGSAQGFGSDFGGGFGGFGFGGGGGETQFEDFFDVLFGRGGGSRRRAGRPGNDLEYPLTITLLEAARGVTKKIKFGRMENCADCAGTGASPGSSPELCSDCGGTGQVRRAQGFFSITQSCPRCRGRGRVIAKPCSRCSGGGRVRKERELSIDLPAGVDTGNRLRVPGEGEPGEGGGPRGDLYIHVEVKPHEIFTRDGNDVICEMPISFTQATLGDKLRVPTLEGEADLKIPAGTQSGQVFRLRNMGISDVRGYRKGDQLVKIHVETPTRISREQRELLERFQTLSDQQSYPLHKRFMDKIRESFGG